MSRRKPRRGGQSLLLIRVHCLALSALLAPGACRTVWGAPPCVLGAVVDVSWGL